MDELVRDALVVLEELEDAELDGEQAEAVGLRGVVAGQDVEPGEGRGRGGSPARSLPTESSAWSTPTAGTCTSRGPATATATRPIRPPNLRPDWSLRPRPPTPLDDGVSYALDELVGSSWSCVGW